MTPMKERAFPKSQRLCSRYLINKLFEPGNSRSLSAYPMRLVFSLRDKPEKGAFRGNDDNALLISVPKRCFKHAVDRNKVKRQVREAYRNATELLHVPEGKIVDMAVIWLDNKHYPSAVVTAKVQNLLRRMSEKINS